MDESFQSCFPNLPSAVLIAQCSEQGSGSYPDLSLVRCDASSIIKSSVLLQQPELGVSLAIATMPITIISPSWLAPLSWA